jgi:hypothetical protein
VVTVKRNFNGTVTATNFIGPAQVDGTAPNLWLEMLQLTILIILIGLSNVMQVLVLNYIKGFAGI